MNLYLIGYRCTGKTSVGNALARTLAWPFIDTDSEIVNVHGLTVKEIVRVQGWKSFREKEKQVLVRVAALDKHVIATGGGVVIDPENVTCMQNSGVTVWLKATPETIKKRMLLDDNAGELRPALTSKGNIDEIEETLIKRRPLYENAMDFAVDTDFFGIDDISSRILNWFKG
jgi:shikimate kinase